MSDYIKAVIGNTIIIGLYLFLGYVTKAWWLTLLSSLFVSLPLYDFTKSKGGE